MPPQNRFRSDDLRYLSERFPTQSLGNLGQADALRVCEQYSPLDLVTEDSVLRHQVFVAQQEFLIDDSPVFLQTKRVNSFRVISVRKESSVLEEQAANLAQFRSDGFDASDRLAIVGERET